MYNIWTTRTKERKRMPRQHEGKTYYNGVEAEQFFDVSPVTFRQLRGRYGLVGISIPGWGQSKWYDEEDLKKIQQKRFGQEDGKQ